MIRATGTITIRLAQTPDVAAVEIEYEPPDLLLCHPADLFPVFFDGSAKRRPGDTRNLRLGADLATLRALRQLVAHLEAGLPEGTETADAECHYCADVVAHGVRVCDDCQGVYVASSAEALGRVAKALASVGAKGVHRG